jgi:hypothetical protein
MLVAVVGVRVVGMAVPDRYVHVRMAMRLARRAARLMGVLMVFVMDVGMRVLECLVIVTMIMALGEMQPHANARQDCGEPGLPGQRLA